MIKLTAVIIKGNPEYIKDNYLAENFYNEIKNFLEDLGYQVSFDEGASHTIPKNADLWIGHSRGCERLRFASKNVKTIALSSNLKGSVNHPLDKAIKKDKPDKFHYLFNDEMKKIILEKNEEVKKVSRR